MEYTSCSDPDPSYLVFSDIPVSCIFSMPNPIPIIEFVRHSLQQDRWYDCLLGVDNRWPSSEVAMASDFLNRLITPEDYVRHTMDMTVS